MVLMVDGFCKHCLDDEKSSEEDEIDLARSCWYSFMAMLMDEETQRRGIISICFHNKPGTLKRMMDFSFFVDVNKLDVAIPYRSGGWHYCYTASQEAKEEKDPFEYFVKGLALFCEVEERLKFRTHQGTHEDIQFKLQTFGIPMKDCPIHMDGTWDTAFHSEWLQGLRIQEAKRRTTKCSERDASNGKSNTDGTTNTMIPKKCDVLFGKSARARDHAGNMRAHDLVEEYFEAYEVADKAGKTSISNHIISRIKEIGGRFLKQCKHGGWEEVTDTVARQKIAHWCRHLRHKKNNMTSQELRAPVATAVADTAASKRVTPPPQDLLDKDHHLGKKPATTSWYE